MRNGRPYDRNSFRHDCAVALQYERKLRRSISDMHNLSLVSRAVVSFSRDMVRYVEAARSNFVEGIRR
jgi:hypothetical protein